MTCDENNLEAQRAAVAEDCAAETAKTHGVDPVELAQQLPGGGMGQKKNKQTVRIDAGSGIQVKRIKQLLNNLDSPGTLSARLKNQLAGPDGLPHLAAATTILAIDYGGTTPSGTCEVIAEEVPSLYRAWGDSRVLAVCEEIQYSEIPEQSRLYQQMFQESNIQYFAGRLPDYKVRVVYDVWHWETVHCGHADSSDTHGLGFVDFPGRQIFIRFLGFHTDGHTMAESLIEEMAHAAAGDGDDEARWQTEMARLKDLGAPVRDDF